MIMHNEIQEIKHWIWKTVMDANMKGVVLGLSGGVDSAVVACLAAEAMLIQDDLQVRAYALPIVSSESVKIAANHAGILKSLNPDSFHFSVYSLENDYQDYIHRFGLSFTNSISADKKQLIQANIMARLRMITLYAKAQVHDMLVIGTENKTENKLGYFTKWGDGASDFEPILEFLKTEVFEIAEYYVNRSMLPREIIERPPSAELWTGQTDEGELGASYADIDKLLAWLEIKDKLGTTKLDLPIPVNNHVFANICNRIQANKHKHTVKHYERSVYEYKTADC